MEDFFNINPFYFIIGFMALIFIITLFAKSAPEKLSEKEIKSKVEIPVMNSIRIITNACKDEKVPTGNSKIGGNPDLHSGFIWPMISISKDNSGIMEIVSKPLSFLAQINLSETASFDIDNLLPKTGWLYFFVNEDKSIKSNDELKPLYDWSVKYYDGDRSQLLSISPPEELKKKLYFPTNKIEFKSIPSIPESESLEISKMIGIEGFFSSYEGYITSFNTKNNFNIEDGYHKLLGYPNSVTSTTDVIIKAVLDMNGMDYINHLLPEEKATTDSSADWCLLFQTENLQSIKGIYSNVATYYFLIKKEDLSNANFSNVFMLSMYV